MLRWKSFGIPECDVEVHATESGQFLPPTLLGTESVLVRVFGSMEMGELYLQLMVIIGCDLCDFVCILDLQKSSGYGSLHCILPKCCIS